MVRLAIGIYNANSNPAMTALYFAVLFNHPFVREEYEISSLSGEHIRFWFRQHYPVHLLFITPRWAPGSAVKERLPSFLEVTSII